MAHACIGRDSLPIAAPQFKQGADLCIKVGTHAPIIAKFCDDGKQHFANRLEDTVEMGSKPINVVVAEALRFYMGDAWSNVSLAKRSGVAEGTIRNYLSPGKREAGKTGKEPSAKVTELAKIAEALGITVAELVTEPAAGGPRGGQPVGGPDNPAGGAFWPFEAVELARFEALTERQKGRIEQALLEATAAIEAESRKRSGTDG